MLSVINSLHDGFLLLVLVVAVLISAYCLYDGLYIYFRASDSELAKYKPGNSSYSGEDSPITDEMVAGSRSTTRELISR